MMKKKGAKPIADSAARKSVTAPRTLALDIGGTGIKALTLDPAGKPLNDRIRVATPRHARPRDVIAIVRKVAAAQPAFDRVSAGFPGVVKHGIIYTAANLGKGWIGFDLRRALERKLKQPVRIANDADIQGLGCVSGHGLELVITLGTGFGSVLFADGARVHLELAHHPFHHGRTYEDELGEGALKRKGRKKWSKLLQEAIGDLQQTFNYDRLYIGGGNSRLVKFKLPAGVKIVSNDDGLLGGIALWRDARPAAARPAAKSPLGPVKLPAKALSQALSRTALRPPTSASTSAATAESKPARTPVSKPKRTAAKPVFATKAPATASAESASSQMSSTSSPANGSPQPADASD